MIDPVVRYINQTEGDEKSNQQITYFENFSHSAGRSLSGKR